MCGSNTMVCIGLAAGVAVSSLVAHPTHAAEPRLHSIRVTMRAAEIEVQGRLDDPDGAVTSVDVYLRAFDRPYRKESTTPENRAFGVAVPTADLLQGESSGKVGYYLIGRSASGAPLMSLGTAESPISVIVTELVTPADLKAFEAPGPTTPSKRSLAPAAVESPWYERWWTWAIVGAVVVGGVTTAVVLTQH